MADMLKITQLVNAKNYSMPTRPLETSDTVFNLADMSKVLKTNDRSDEFRQTDNSPSNPNTNLLKAELNISKSPDFSAAILKGLLSDEFAAQLLNSGSPDVINEFNEFTRNIFLTGENVAADLNSQQQGSTTFKGELFNALRQLVSQNPSPEMKTAVAQLLKSAFALCSQPEILKSLSANFMHFAEELYPSRSLSESLEQLSNEFAKPDAALKFTELKSEALKLLNSVSNSLVATDEIKNLVSLVKYNLSRFSDNPKSLLDAFKSLADMIPDDEFKAQLEKAFSTFIQDDSIPEITKRALNFSNAEADVVEKSVFDLAEVVKETATAIPKEQLETALNTVAQQLAKLIDDSGKHPVISLGDGAAQLGLIMSLVLPEGSDEDLKRVLQNFYDTKDLNALVGRLSHIINSIDNYEMKMALSKLLNEVLTALANNDDVNYKQPSSMDYLSEFLSKTLSNENIAHLGIVEPRSLVEGILTSPGVFTPLLHYVIPLKIGDLKSFGEVWIDNETMINGSETKSNHIFMSFDIEHIGVFELEMMAQNNSINVNLFCPHGLEKTFSNLKPAFARVADNAGYSLGKTNIRALRKVRNLVEVFPRIAERRSGLNAKV